MAPHKRVRRRQRRPQRRPQRARRPPAAAAGYSGFAQCSAAIFAVVNVSIAATGTGFLAFPFAFSQAGMALGVALCVITSLLCGYSLVVIAHCANQYQAKSYQQLVYLMFGVRAQHFIEWSVIGEPGFAFEVEWAV